MNEIKYEAVFGDQLLLSEALEDHVAVCVNDYPVRQLYYLTQEELDQKDSSYLKAIPVLAMRRIIKTPVWTKSDKEAGRLPEVGCAVMVGPETKAIITAYDSIQKVFAVQCEDESLDILKIHEILPIESPEEKAARLREEWCSNALGSASILSGMQEYELKRLGGYIGNIYDALLSGNLPVPVKEK